MTSNLLECEDCMHLQNEAGNLVLPEPLCGAVNMFIQLFLRLHHDSSVLRKSTAKDVYACIQTAVKSDLY